MTRAQELLAEIRDDLRELNIWELLQPEIRDAVHAELATAARPLPRWAAGTVVGEQVHRRLGLVRDDDPFAVSWRALNAQIDAADEDD